ncbi:(d)CMP kinase [Aureivirga marina]|uniref:(d)CMP kinase n=1 Tax=Aureivirga marina TaxID=1182451 RepID=UPI0018CA31B0|nr:(d)CMP kinase [Aureivirga marina]
MESKKITIAIDGFSSTGKSTIAKELAKKLGYVYVDTGAMYRAVTYFAMINDYVSDETLNKEGLIAQLNNIKLKFVFNPDAGFSEIHLNGENIEKQIRGLEVSQLVSKVAAITEVRKVLVSQQQEMGKDKGVVMDGRDIGTVVFPDAELKLFMTASPDKRAKRRYKELLDKGEDIKFEDVLKNVQTRDHIDTTRTDSPLKRADDAIEFDNSDMGLKEQFERVYNITQRTIQGIK